MDDAEAGPRVVICSRCNEFGHSYKKCNSTAQGTTGNIPETGSSSQAIAAPQGYVTPQLLDAATDMKHRSYFSAVLGCSLGHFRARVPMETMALDHRWVPRLRASGLLPLARLVEGDRPRFSYDFSLLAALVDRWRSETHTFHLTVGEMAPTLQDVSYLLGLPLRGDAMGPTDVGQGWREDLPARFGPVRRSGTAPPYGEFAPTHTGGPPKWWILRFKLVRRVRDCRALGGLRVVVDGPGDVLRLRRRLCAEAPTPFARYVADAPPEAIPRFSRGSAVLAATYRGLCTGCLKSSGAEPIFGGVRYFCSSPGSREVSIGRPAVLHMPYRGYPMDDVDGPTMGSLWCDQRLSALTLKLNASRFAYAHVRTRKSYPDFAGSTSSVTMRFGGSLILGRRSAAAHPRARHRRAYATQYRRTRSPPVFDIYVEEHARHRVLRRFGLFREIVVPTSLLPPHAHGFVMTTCSYDLFIFNISQDGGRSVGRLWTPRLAEFVAGWTTALDDVVMEGRPHDDAAWGHYLRWYLPRTRVRVLSTPRELPRRAPDVTDGYPTRRDRGASLAVSFFTELNTSKLYLLTN
ncbi:LOW QUALITY PROTEIN: hypothetical protein U9M48_005962 [Paspalum notatum var. saurae]|uniref:Aminotransferase-like plant mobile domain-containing protein n=1 Tax=Paspalum notatum var. saurae TaxID=547442 RepID=A0AAQ3PXR8_PASNO